MLFELCEEILLHIFIIKVVTVEAEQLQNTETYPCTVAYSLAAVRSVKTWVLFFEYMYRCHSVESSKKEFPAYIKLQNMHRYSSLFHKDHTVLLDNENSHKESAQVNVKYTQIDSTIYRYLKNLHFIKSAKNIFTLHFQNIQPT